MYTALALIFLLSPGQNQALNQHLQPLITEASSTNSPELALQVAQGLIRVGRTDDALRWINTAAKRGADRARIHLFRGDAYFYADRWVDATGAYFEAFSTAPENGYLQVQLWKCLRMPNLEGKLDLNRIRTALEEHGIIFPPTPSIPSPTKAKQLTDSAYSALKSGRFRSALEGFRAAIAHKNSYADAWRGLGITYVRMDQRQRGHGAYRIFLAMSLIDSHDVRQTRRILLSAERQRGLSLDKHR